MANRIYVGNLSFDTTEGDLEQAFAQFGEVVETKVMMDRDTGRSRGFGFVTMATADAFRAAIEQMDGAELDGRSLRVNEAEERRERPRGGGGGFGGGGGERRGGGGGGGGGGRGGRRGGSDRRGGGDRW